MIKEHDKENRETFELFTRQADRLLSLSFSTFWRSATKVEIKGDTKNNGSCEKKGRWFLDTLIHIAVGDSDASCAVTFASEQTWGTLQSVITPNQSYI